MLPYSVSELRFLKGALQLTRNLAGELPPEAINLTHKLNRDIRMEQSRETLNHPHTPDHRKAK